MINLFFASRVNFVTSLVIGVSDIKDCEQSTAAVSYLLDVNGIAHQIVCGELFHGDATGAVITPHYWIAVETCSGNLIIDTTIDHWLGTNGESGAAFEEEYQANKIFHVNGSVVDKSTHCQFDEEDMSLMLNLDAQSLVYAGGTNHVEKIH